ncbi:MAG: DUF4271 domain-containing protein [Bacteroidales bacterium]
MFNSTGQSLLPGNITDSTSYIYTTVSKNVPLSDNFIPFKFVRSPELNTTTGQNSKAGSISVDKSASGEMLIFQYSDFVLLGVIFLFVLLAYVRFYGKNYIYRLNISIFNYSYSNSFYKEKNLAFVFYGNLLLVIFYISSTMLCKSGLEYAGYFISSYGHWVEFIILLIFILTAVSLHKLAYNILGRLFGQIRLSGEYMFYLGNLLKVLGIIYLILFVGVYFTENIWKSIFLYSALFVTIIAYLIKISRLVMVLFTNQFSIYYLILYFCALEILPLAIISKFLIQLDQAKIQFMLDALV